MFSVYNIINMYRLVGRYDGEVSLITADVEYKDVYDEFLSYLDNDEQHVFCETTGLFYANGKWFTPDPKDYENMREDQCCLFIPSKEEFYETLDEDEEYKYSLKLSGSKYTIRVRKEE